MVEQRLADAGSLDLEAGHSVDSVNCKTEAIRLVLDSQLQRCIDVPLLLVAPHMDVVLTGSAICEPVNQPWIGVEVEDDWLVRCENSLELPIRQTMRMLGAGNQPEKIDHVYKSHLHLGYVLSKQSCSGQRLHCWAIAATRHDYIGLSALVVARPIPNANAFRAMLDCGFHVQVLKMHLLVRNYDVDVVNALQAVICDRQQAVSVGRQLDSNVTCALVGDHVKEA